MSTDQPTPRVGMVLRGTETYPGGSSTKTIRITYVSDQYTLALDLADGRESSWTLDARPWEVVEDAPQPAPVDGDAVERAALTHARAFVPDVQEAINDDAGDDPDPQWVYDRLIESLAVIDSMVEAFGSEYAGSEQATQAGLLVGRAARVAARAGEGDAATPTVTAEQIAEAFCEATHRGSNGWPLVGEDRYCGRCIDKASAALGIEMQP